MFKLALDSGHGLYTAGKRCLKSLDPNETREWVLNNRICNKIQDKLSAYDGIKILRVDDVTGQTDVSLAERCRRANEWGADYYLSIHHNAYKPDTGCGFEVYIYIGLSANGATAKKQEIIYEELVAAGVSKGNRSSNVKSANFTVLRNTNMEAALVECAFMDSSVDVPVLLTDDFAERVAIGCVNAIVRFANLQKKVIQESQKVEEVNTELPKEEPVPDEPIINAPVVDEPVVEETPEIEKPPEPTKEIPESKEPLSPKEEKDVETTDKNENVIISFFKIIINFIKKFFRKN